MILDRFHSFVSRSRISGLVDRIVSRSHNAVWRRVRDRVTTMGPHEARGYIRARAALVVDRELNIAASELPHLTQRHWQHISQQVRQRLIQLTLADALRMQKATSSAPKRRAA